MGVSIEHNYLPHAYSFSSKYRYSLIEQSLVFICDCYIREYYKPGIFELDPATQMT